MRPRGVPGLLLLAALAVAIWMEWISVPGISLRQADSSPLSVGPIAGSTGTPAPAEDPAADRGVTGGVEAPEPAAAPTPEGEGAADPAPGAAATVELADTEAPVQGWTLRLGAFRSQSVARQEAGRYQALAPDHLFTVVPVDLGDTRWFRVVSAAGPLSRSEPAHRRSEPPWDQR